ncbi:MAG: DUF4231 domain-containing protein [Terriglobia bacterium]|nr:DUF4231 domain-containing protein [Terriglobia bacterium]
MTREFSEPDYPPLRNAANRASISAQRVFLRLNRIQLLLLTSAAFVSGVQFKNPEHQHEESWVVFVIMLTALAVTTVLRIGKFDDRWFRCRAYAENFKSLVWLYVMSANASSDSSEQEYLNSIAHLKERLPDLQKEFARYGIAGKLITDWMCKARSLTVEHKLAMYHALRIDDQMNWYSDKAKFNSRKEGEWFWSIVVIEFLAVAGAALQANQLLQLNPVSGIAALGTALIAWSQIKRFSDLGTSYAIAANDICEIAESHRRVETQAELDVFVQQIETAVSREHSMWLARRSVV